MKKSIKSILRELENQPHDQQSSVQKTEAVTLKSEISLCVEEANKLRVKHSWASDFPRAVRANKDGKYEINSNDDSVLMNSSSYQQHHDQKEPVRVLDEIKENSS